MKFPGVGPKQATRFVFYLLREDEAEVESFASAIARLQSDVKICRQCYKTFDTNPSTSLDVARDRQLGTGGGEKELCEICRDTKRNKSEIMVIEKEVDLGNIERTHKFSGLYHVLGGIVSPLDSTAPSRLHLRELFERIQTRAKTGDAIEVILGTNPTAEGDATALYIERIVTPLKNQYQNLTLSRLGRGLTTGSELEYSDDITIANALVNRK